MYYWAVFLLSITLTASAENTLYDELKSQQLSTYVFSIEPMLLEDTLLERLAEPFPLINGGRGKDYLPQYVNVNETLPYRYKKLIEDSIYLQLIMLSSIGILATLPDDITNWNAEKLQERSLEDRWKDNVSTVPVWDNDDWIINYIGHPISGAYYYTMARNDGMSIGESAAFSALMSTFFWEYGYEAFAEVPSIQDIIVTPLFGSLFGEGMIILQKKLDQRDGVIFGSRSLGNISYFLLDPLGNIAHGMRSILKRFNIDIDVTMTIQSYPKAIVSPYRYVVPTEDAIRYQEREYGFIITLQ